jgi:hypothetical protein
MKKKWLFIVLILTGCSTSQITSSWKNAGVPPQKFDPVMVVGIMNDADSSLCRKMEQQFAGKLKELGYNAFSSIAVYGPKEYNNIQEEEVFKLIYNRDICAVITIELLQKQKEVYPAPLILDNDYYRHLRPYENQGIDRQDHYLVQTNYIWESNYYDMSGFLMLYSVKSKLYEPGSEKALAKEYAKMILDDMMKNGLLQKQVVVLKPF